MSSHTFTGGLLSSFLPVNVFHLCLVGSLYLIYSNCTFLPLCLRLACCIILSSPVFFFPDWSCLWPVSCVSDLLSSLLNIYSVAWLFDVKVFACFSIQPEPPESVIVLPLSAQCLFSCQRIYSPTVDAQVWIQPAVPNLNGQNCAKLKLSWLLGGKTTTYWEWNKEVMATDCFFCPSPHPAHLVSTKQKRFFQIWKDDNLHSRGYMRINKHTYILYKTSFLMRSYFKLL